MNPDPQLLGKVKVVLDQGVLGAVAAADHAGAALVAAGPVRTFTTEVGVGDGYVRLPEVDADLRIGVGVVGAGLSRVLVEESVGRPFVAV